jgi:hypothetical protein
LQRKKNSGYQQRQKKSFTNGVRLLVSHRHAPRWYRIEVPDGIAAVDE